MRAADIADRLTTPGWRVEAFGEVGSTNDVARARAEAGEPAGLVVVAERQTAGKGRKGRSFHSPAGSGLYMSLLLRPFDADRITTIAAVAVAEAIERVSGKRAGIKWVNDLFLDGKKICGILAEGAFDGGKPLYTVLGIGIDVYPAPLPDGLKEVVGSVFDRKPDGADRRGELAAAVLDGFTGYYNGQPYAEAYRARSLAIGRTITVVRGQERLTAVALGVDDDCRLVIRAGGRVEALSSGEISIRVDQ